MTDGTTNPRRWWILMATSGVLGLVVLDETVVGVALPTIQRDLAMSQAGSHWVVNAYLLSFTCFVALGGRLGDMFGRGRLFLSGIALVGLGSLAAGIAPAAWVLLAARALQGLGAAMVFPAGFALATSLFRPEERGLAFGLQTTIAAVFMASGPVVGGYFTEAISWRWIFWVNLPAVAAITGVVWFAWLPTLDRTVPPSIERGPRFDIGGLAALVVGLTAFTVGLMQGSDWGWGTPPTLACLVGGLAILALFVVLELKRAAPLIALDLLRIPAFSGGVAIFFVFQFNKIVVFVFLPLYLQKAMGYSPVASGLPLLLAILPTLVTSLLAGKSADRVGPRRLILFGLAVNGAALVALAVAAASGSYPAIVVALLFWGSVLPFMAVVARRTLMSAVPPAQQGQASGVNLTLQMTGGTMGLALATTVLAATGAFPPVFAMTGFLVLAMLPVAWCAIEGAPGTAGLSKAG
ncbi:MFS transporter [Amorphus coralli]|uniref:MFS transporter n=1 Tax=Amorphus coralli TaxID=340680 RepID=UPI000406E1BD|nr:MFS transporter [Amorphus coralli]